MIISQHIYLDSTAPKQRERAITGIALQNQIISSFGTLLLGDEDSYETHPYSFSGISEVYQQFKMDIAGAAEMPATKLFGQSPDGMNATGESDIINYNESISQKQENMLRALLERLLPIMCLSLWGEIPDDLEIEFESIDTLTDDEKATIANKDMTTITAAYTAGIIGRKTALMELKKTGQSVGRWDSISDDDVEEAENEPDGMGEEDLSYPSMTQGQEEESPRPEAPSVAQDAWNEEDHPRDREGQFSERGDTRYPEKNAPEGAEGREKRNKVFSRGSGKRKSSELGKKGIKEAGKNYDITQYSNARAGRNGQESYQEKPAVGMPNKEVLNKHYMDHNKDFGFNTAKEYEKAGIAFMNAPFDKDTEEMLRFDRIMRYNKSMMEFGIVDRNEQYLITYMKPQNGLSYWAVQLEEYKE